MNKLLVIISLALSSMAFAHDDHGWRMDYKAFINVRVSETIMTKGLPLFADPKSIDREYFKKHLITFASIKRGSDKNLDLSRNFLAEEYTKLGFEVSPHPFGSWTNFIAEKKGTSSNPKILILSSHIDSVGNIPPIRRFSINPETVRLSINDEVAKDTQQMIKQLRPSNSIDSSTHIF